MLHLFLNLKASNATDPNKIPSCMPSKRSSILTDNPFSHSASISQESVPSAEWRMVNAVVIFKKESIPSSYRLVSLTSIICYKILV